VIDFDENLGSEDEEYDKYIESIKAAGQNETTAFVEHCRPDNYEED